MTKADRMAMTARAERRRWENYRADSVERIERRPRKYWGEPTHEFCMTHMGLALLWWSARILSLARSRQWMLHNHACGCFHCKPEKRKWQGNSVIGQPLQ